MRPCRRVQEETRSTYFSDWTMSGRVGLGWSFPSNLCRFGSHSHNHTPPPIYVSTGHAALGRKSLRGPVGLYPLAGPGLVGSVVRTKGGEKMVGEKPTR
ncbi:unnamed protein product [Protopolystoma xenopodis]|uniref:Uncharacterized protein n=1 Tax=Protopolystoma xenopodis TaxID=117903 RepID=A0A448XDM9_9PLAT|nr:unnamed protein product [Protopolystoma xenopodis]